TVPKPKAQTNLLNVQASTTTTAPGKQAKPGGNLTMAVAAETASFDPAKGNSNGGSNEGPRNEPIFDTLFFQDSATYDLVAQQALGITSTDAKVWDLKLRPNVKFTDGTTLDAAAVKFNFLRVQGRRQSFAEPLDRPDDLRHDCGRSSHAAAYADRAQ